MRSTIVLFGESEKGDFRQAYYCKSPADLSDYLGEPPTAESRGIPFALQALLYERGVIFFRVHEEGFSTQDYLRGLNMLEESKLMSELAAICLPGVGSAEIIDATARSCALYKSFLVITESDLYDYLTFRN